MDRILIEGLELFARHGVHVEEREIGQVFSIDVELQGDFRPTHDELSATVDYMAVVRLVQEFNRAHQFQLIESLAHALSEQILNHFPRVQRTRVRVSKHPSTPMGLRLSRVAVEIERERGHA